MTHLARGGRTPARSAAPFLERPAPERRYACVINLHFTNSAYGKTVAAVRARTGVIDDVGGMCDCREVALRKKENAFVATAVVTSRVRPAAVTVLYHVRFSDGTVWEVPPTPLEERQSVTVHDLAEYRQGVGILSQSLGAGATGPAESCFGVVCLRQPVAGPPVFGKQQYRWFGFVPVQNLPS